MYRMRYVRLTNAPHAGVRADPLLNRPYLPSSPRRNFFAKMRRDGHATFRHITHLVLDIVA